MTFIFSPPIHWRTWAAPARLLAGQSLVPPPSYSMAPAHTRQFTPPRKFSNSWPKTDPVDSPPPILSRHGTSRLLLVSDAEEGAGVPDFVPWRVQDKVGGGHKDTDQRWLHQGVPEVDGAMRKVYWGQQLLCQEKLQNTFCSNYNCFSFFLFIIWFWYHVHCWDEISPHVKMERKTLREAERGKRLGSKGKNK